MTALVVGLGLLVLLLGVLVVGLLRSHAEIIRALHALGVDLSHSSPSDSAIDALPRPRTTTVVVPDSVSGFDPQGGALTVSLSGPGKLTLLAFLSSGCLTCRPMWEALGRPARTVAGGARVIAVSKGPHEESPASINAVASPHLTTIMSSDAWADFGVPGSPYFVLVDGARQIVGEGTATTWQRVVELLDEALADASTDALPSSPRRRGGAARRQHVDDTLRAAGIEAGHSSLHPDR